MIPKTWDDIQVGDSVIFDIPHAPDLEGVVIENLGNFLIVKNDFFQKKIEFSSVKEVFAHKSLYPRNPIQEMGISDIGDDPFDDFD